MRRPLAAIGTALFASALVFASAASASADAGAGTVDGGSITIPGFGIGDPYPSAGTMSGVSGTITSITLTLTGLTHTFPRDLQILLQSPSGQSLMVMSRCGDNVDIVDGTLTFIDGYPALSSNDALISGTYAPTTCFGYPTGAPTPSPTVIPVPQSSPMPSPAPVPPYVPSFASLNGTDPNGEWKLWILDTLNGDLGLLDSWTVTVTTEVPAVAVAAPAATLPNMGVDVSTIALAVVALLAAGGILLYTHRRYSL